MTRRPMHQGFHLDLNSDQASVTMFIVALVVLMALGAGLCGLIPWR